MGEQIQITLSTATLLAIIGIVIREFLKARNSKKTNSKGTANPNGAALREYLKGQFALQNQCLDNMKEEIKDGFKEVAEKLEHLAKKINASS